MAIALEEALKRNISQDKLLPVYILFGEEGYLKKNYSDKILGLITSEDDIFNCVKFEGNCDLQAVYDAVLQLPFMADRKYVEICDFDFEACSKTDFDRLCTMISEIPDTAVLVLRYDNTEFDSKKSARFNKLVSVCEKAGGIAANLGHRKTSELVRMLCGGAAKRGIKMETAAAEYLVLTAGEDINLLKNELEKLCAYSAGEVITKQTVENVSVKTTEASVYNLSGHIIQCDVTKALKVLDDLFFMKVEPMVILYTVSSVYVDMMRVFAAGREVSRDEISKMYSYKNRAFLLDRARTNLRKFDRKKLRLSLDALTDADNSLKSFGADARIVLEQLIIRLIYIIEKGESVDKP